MKKDKLIAKSRRYEVIIFDDSLPSDWQSILDGTGYPMAFILHDRDYDEVTGELIKPHYHILIDAGAAVQMSTIYNSVCLPLGHSNLPKPIKANNKRYQYLTHKNIQNKAQYNESDIVLLNDFSGRAFEKRSQSDTDQVDTFNYIIDLIEQHNLKDMYSLNNYLRYNNEYDAQKLVIYKPNLFKSYMSDRLAHKSRDQLHLDTRWKEISKEIDNVENSIDSNVTSMDDASC